MSYVIGRKVGKRVHAYDAYLYLKKQGHDTKEFIAFMKRKHPRIYKKELELHIRTGCK